MDNIIEIISDALRALFGFLCDMIYPFIAVSYDLFIKLGKVAFSDGFEEIYKRVSLIIGIFMVFRITFWLIESLVNPNNLSDKEKNPGKIISKVLISVILLATTPTIFKYAMDIQNKILDSKIIEKVISYDGKTEIDASSTGKYLAAELFINFYSVGQGEKNGEIITFNDHQCIKMQLTDEARFGSVYRGLLTSGTLNINNSCLTTKGPEDTKEFYVIDFNGLFATAVGIFVIWMIIMYSVSVGARIIQLVFLQIIAPIPIMCNIAPGKDNMFSKWVKQCTTTYLDLFIRVAIINFVMLLCRMILSNDNNIFTSLNSAGNFWIKIFLVLGLLIFAKKAPDLIQELLPKSVTKASGDFGLSWKKRTDSMLGGKLVYGASRMATLGAAGAVATGAVGFLGSRGAGKFAGLLGGVTKGLAAGAKSGNVFKNFQSGIKQQKDANKKRIDWANNGSTWHGRMEQRMANALGFEGRAEQMENEIKEIDNQVERARDSIAQQKRKVSTYKKISDSKSSMESRAENKILNETFDPIKHPKRVQLQQTVLTAKAKVEHLQQTGASADDIAAAQIAYNAALKKAKKEYIDGVFDGSIKDVAMISMIEDLRNTVRMDQDNSFEGMHPTVTDYESLETFEGEAAGGKSRELQGYTDAQGNRVVGINEVESQIQVLEDQKANIKAREEYKRAVADRNAVGGHSGGKK